MAPMDTEAEILRALHGLAAAFNAHDIEGVMSFFAPDCSLDMPHGTEPHGTRHKGFEQVKKGLMGRFASTPDVHYSDVEHFVSGNCGMSKWLLAGTKLNGAEVTGAGLRLLHLSARTGRPQGLILENRRVRPISRGLFRRDQPSSRPLNQAAWDCPRSYRGPSGAPFRRSLRRRAGQ